MASIVIRREVCLRPYTTLRTGGRAQMLVEPRTADELADAFLACVDTPATLLGHGSNVLPSDDGVEGLVIVNRSASIEIGEQGSIVADAGCPFQELFLKAAQASLSGLEFAVGIPGTLGGALVSNAGAYRSNIGDLVEELEIVFEGRRQWVPVSWLRFSYRDSLLRSPGGPLCALVRAKLRTVKAEGKAIYAAAREFQRQRISKQPSPASAGSFFKNVNDKSLAQALPGLPPSLRDAGVVPAGYLLDAAGMKGVRLNGAAFSAKHGNFIVNVGAATATDIRTLADRAKAAVRLQFGVDLEEEVLYIGDWSRYEE